MSPLAWYVLALLALMLIGIIGGMCYVIEKTVGKVKRTFGGLKQKYKSQNIGGKT